MMDDAQRKLNPLTLALLRKRLRAEAPGAPEAPPQKPLAMIPTAAPEAATHATPPVGPPRASLPNPSTLKPSRAQAPAGVTPFLPGFGAHMQLAKKAVVLKKSVRDGVFDRLSMPDSPLCDVVIVDTETTGAGPGARLVELGALRVRHGKVVEQFSTLVDPEMKIPSYVIAVHGITNAMVVGAPKASPVLAAFLKFVGNCPLMAHNAPFDRGILSQELQRAGMLRPDIPMFCTLKLSRRVFPQAPNHKLSTLARYLKIPDPPSHRAVADCLTTVGVLVACASRHSLATLHTVHGGVVSL